MESSELVSAEWLHKHLSDVKVLDASWHLPQTGRNAHQEYLQQRIPNALFFDIDSPGLCDKSTSLPHMLPSADEFSAKMTDIGITNDDKIVIYASNMFMAAARAWWMFKVFSHKSVAVLEGALEGWVKGNFPIETNAPSAPSKGARYQAVINPELKIEFSDVVQNTRDHQYGVVDARPESRFNLRQDEPRKGVKRGRIPNSINIPCTEVVRDQRLLDERLLEDLFHKKLGQEWKQRKWILSCGSGVTAAIVGLAMSKCNGTNWKLYDGSWAEYGTKNE